MSSLSALLKSNADPSEVLAAAQRQKPNDISAQHAKVVALLKLDRFAEALQEVEASAELRSAAGLEHAYALYKTGRPDEARKIAAGLKGDRGARHLEAQSAYRSEDFWAAGQIYDVLWRSRTDAEESDLRINRGAVGAQLSWSGDSDAVPPRATREDLEVFETAYNAACTCLARGELKQGEILLKRAKDLCAASEDLSEEEKKAELLPISVQQLFVLSSQGETAAAKALADEIAVSEIQDLTTRQVAQINQIALSAVPPNPFLAQRLMQSLPQLPPSEQLSGIQSARVQQNRVALDLLVSKFGAAANTTSALRSSQLNAPTVAPAAVATSVQYAAARAQNQLGKLGINAVLDLHQKEPTDVGFVLVLVQLYVLTNNHGAAIKVMEDTLRALEASPHPSAQEVRFAPGFVAVLVSLYGIEKRRGHVRAELGKAAAYWKSKGRIHSRLFNAAGRALLESGRSEDLKAAGDIFEAAMAADSRDQAAVAGYVAARALAQPDDVAEAAERLTSVEKLTAGIDAAALDEAGIPAVKPAGGVAAGRKRPAAEGAKPPKKRVRKARLPKDLDPEKKADPERWLPLRDRSTYKPRGRKGKQKQQALTQGGMAKEGGEEKASEAVQSSVVKASVGGGKNKKGKKKK